MQCGRYFASLNSRGLLTTLIALTLSRTDYALAACHLYFSAYLRQFWGTAGLWEEQAIHLLRMTATTDVQES